MAKSLSIEEVEHKSDKESEDNVSAIRSSIAPSRLDTIAVADRASMVSYRTLEVFSIA